MRLSLLILAKYLHFQSAPAFKRRNAVSEFFDQRLQKITGSSASRVSAAMFHLTCRRFEAVFAEFEHTFVKV